MTGHDFLRIIHEAFVPFLEDLGFSTDAPSISGRFYRASFTGQKNVVSVSYESGDNALFVMLFNREKNELSDIDDREMTPRLADLNGRYMSLVTPAERVSNELFFKNIVATDKEQRLLLKMAKELRLVLPIHLSQRDKVRPDL